MGNHGNNNNNNNNVAEEAQQCTLFVLTIGTNKALVASITIVITICVLTINFMLIHGTIVTTRRNHSKPFTITQRLFIYMSINDIFTIILFMTKLILDEFGIKIPCFLVIALICLLDGAFTLGSLLFFILSVMRYRAIRNPFLTTSTRFVVGLCIGSTFLSVVFSVVLFYINISLLSPETFQKMMCLISFALFLFIDLVLIVNTMSYLQLVKSSAPTTTSITTTTITTTILTTESAESSISGVKDSSRSSNNNNNNNNKNDSSNNTSPVISNAISDERKKKATETLLLISCIYSVCNTPLPLYTIIKLYRGTLLEGGIAWMQIFYLLMVLNTGFNSLFYILRNGQIRKLYSCSKFRCCQKTIKNK